MTNPIDKAALRALAEAADAQPYNVEATTAFRAAVPAHKVLAMLDEWERTERNRDMWKEQVATQAAQIEACRAEAARVSGYFVSISDRPFASEVLVQRSRQMEGPPKWAARLDGECLNKDGAWEWEPMPSSRDEGFLARCRFDTAAEAIAAVHAAMKEKIP